MDWEPPTDAFTFVLRLWVEEYSSATTPTRWRGHVTNLRDDNRRWVEDFEQIERFVNEYLVLSGRSPNNAED